jgi:hypothetical protein
MLYDPNENQKTLQNILSMSDLEPFEENKTSGIF